MRFKKDEKVLILNKTKECGKIGRVAFDNPNGSVKVLIPGTDGHFWFPPSMLRKVKRNAQFTPVEENDAVKVVDVKGIYADREKIGWSGYVDWVEGHQLTVNFGNKGSYYFELGDIRPIPKQKNAWVVYPNYVKRRLVMFGHCKNGTTIWKDKANYLFNDNFVYNDIQQAVDYLRAKKQEKDSIKIKQ